MGLNNLKYGNRGMNLENEINDTNQYYLNKDIAVIYKKPTPITVSRVSYPINSAARINEGYFKTASTTDYNGIYNGRYIDFEAKETNGNNFPLNNIKKHQLDHLNNIYKHGGIGFIIIRFNNYNETYLIEIQSINKFLINNVRKSIPYEYIKENGYLIKDKYIPRVDYLEVINKIYFGGINEKNN